MKSTLLLFAMAGAGRSWRGPVCGLALLGALPMVAHAVPTTGGAAFYSAVGVPAPTFLRTAAEVIATTDLRPFGSLDTPARRGLSDERHDVQRVFRQQLFERSARPCLGLLRVASA